MDFKSPMKDTDHEAAMARAELYKLAKYSAQLFKMIKEGQELEGWVQSKITKAADYISSVHSHLEYKELSAAEIGPEEPVSYDESVQLEVKNTLREQWEQHKQGR